MSKDERTELNELEVFVMNQVIEILGLDAHDRDVIARFHPKVNLTNEFGLDSLDLTETLMEIEEDLDITISEDMIIDTNNIEFHLLVKVVQHAKEKNEKLFD